MITIFRNYNVALNLLKTKFFDILVRLGTNTLLDFPERKL